MVPSRTGSPGGRRRERRAAAGLLPPGQSPCRARAGPATEGPQGHEGLARLVPFRSILHPGPPVERNGTVPKRNGTVRNEMGPCPNEMGRNDIPWNEMEPNG